MGRKEKSPFHTCALLVLTVVLAVAARLPPLRVRVPEPKAAPLARLRTPALSVMPPVKAFTPPRVKMPAPFLVRLLAVAPLEMMPPTVRLL